MASEPGVTMTGGVVDVVAAGFWVVVDADFVVSSPQVATEITIRMKSVAPMATVLAKRRRRRRLQ